MHCGDCPGNSSRKLPGNSRKLRKLGNSSLSQDAHHGALPTLFAAVSPSAQPGGYYGPDGFLETKGDPTAAKIPAAAKDETVAARLWEQSERLTGTTFASLGRLTRADSSYVPSV